MSREKLDLIAHLMRRAGFGASWDELKMLEENGYDATLEALLDFPTENVRMNESLIRRYHPDSNAMMAQFGTPIIWLYDMVSTSAPLQEKMALFWHGVFATATSKMQMGKLILDQIKMFRQYGMGNFSTLLYKLSTDPAMVYWLDNHDNHKGAINENYGRELLELFSMGVGNYTEQDVKEAARAFTGWSLDDIDYIKERNVRGSIWPYGLTGWEFAYNDEDNDKGEKEFLGHRGNHNGQDIIKIICQQQATARFIARHLYNFFVADEPLVPQWPYIPPKDPRAIELLVDAYYESNYNIGHMVSVLFSSEFFKSKECWNSKVKSPAELAVGVLRLTNECSHPQREMHNISRQVAFMGQDLMNPPGVEGWHGGQDWIESGTLVERINFASEHIGNDETPGVKNIIGNVDTSDPEQLIDSCLDHLGAISINEDTRASILRFVDKCDPDKGFIDEALILNVLRMIVSSQEFQRV